jgi:predicted DCC family thiol-disulfide oxidoreductase YuxK
VLFVIDRDPHGRFAFAPLQSDVAAGLLRERRYESNADFPASIVLIEGERVYDRSTAVLRIVRGLSGLWPALSVLLAIPGRLRDLVYDWSARRRYRWFGRLEACRLPTAELRSRFLV